MGGLGIEPHIELVSRRVRELGIIGLGIQTRAHEDQFFGELGKFRIDRNGQRKIRHRSALVDRDLSRKLVDHAHQEMGGIFIR